MVVETNDTAQAANILLSAGVMASGAGALANDDAGFSGYLSLLELRKIVLDNAQPDQDRMAQNLARQLKARNNRLNIETRRLILQMIETGMPAPEEFGEQGLPASALVDLMIEKIEQQAVDQTIAPETIDAFRRILLPILDSLLNDNTFTTTLAPQLWRKTLQRQERIETQVENVPHPVVDLLLRQGPIQPHEQTTISLNDLCELADKFGAAPEMDEIPLIRFLSYKADEYRAFHTLIGGLNERVPAVANLKGAIQDAASRLDFEAVDLLLSQPEVVENEITANTGQTRAANALLQGRTQLAYDILSAAADSFASIDAIEPSRRRGPYGSMLYKHGVRFSGDALQLAVQMWGKAAADVDQKSDADLWAGLQNDIGNTLSTLGQRDSGTMWLEQAITAYRNAITVQTHDRMPQQWAVTQNNLGNALQTLGQRETGTAWLAQAIEAYHNALTVRTQDRMPQEWAVTQTNLGNALSTVGQRESDTAWLKQAIEAYRNALMVQTQNRMPQQWAATQNNLGNTLEALGQREGSTTRLEQALQAHHNALTVRTQDRMPQEWAVTQNNLGNALKSLGQRKGSTARLEQALEAYGNALTVRTQDEMPQQWAITQNNLGNALKSLGQREGGIARLEQALEAYGNALTVRTQDGMPLEWAVTQNNLGDALQALGQRVSGTAMLKQAITAYQNALKVHTQNRMPQQWAVTQNNLGTTLSTVGQRQSGTSWLKQAIEAYLNVLAEWTQQRMPLEWATTQGNLGSVYMAYFDRTHDQTQLENAENHLQAAKAVFEKTAPQYAGMAGGQLQEITALRAQG